MIRQRFIFWATELRQTAVGVASAFVDDEEAEDVAQEVLLRMWEKVVKLEDDESRLKAFAVVTARNLSQNRLRQKRRHPLLRLLSWHDSEHEDSPQRNLEASEADAAFATAMKRLPYNWRRVLEMRNVEEMSFAEIAAVMGTTESSVRGQLSKARKRMVELINKQIL